VDEPLVIAVSPYHLTTREAPAVAALQLADSVVTLLPAPATGRSRADVHRAVKKCPRYLRMLDSWRWTMPLWHEGVIASAVDDNEVSEELPASYERIGEEEAYAALRPLMKHVVGANPDHFLDLLSGDILKGGPDPALNIPVSAAIDGFASRHGIAVARAAATSLAQRAEVKLGRRAFAVAVPVLMHASARLILLAREQLADELRELRCALGRACREAAEGDSIGEATQGALTRAAKRYSVAFEELRQSVEGRDDDEGMRIATGYVSIAGMVLPADVAIRSGLAAARSAQARAGPSPARNGVGAHGVSTRLVVLVIKSLSARPDVER
jgi:hypothetical protein